MSTRDQFASAKAYLQAGNYREARRVLRQIDHPKAKQWLRQIDQRQPRRGRKVVAMVGYAFATLLFAAGVWPALLFFNAPLSARGPYLLATLLCFIGAYLLYRIAKYLNA